MAAAASSSDELSRATMLDAVSAIEVDVQRVAAQSSQEWRRAMVLLGQIESQINFGEFCTEEEMRSDIEELGSIMRDLKASTKTLDKVNMLSNLYSKYSHAARAADVPCIALIGETGVGKSTLGNVFLGRKQFDTSSSGSRCTRHIQRSQGHWLSRGREVVVIDTPGLNDKDMEDAEALERIVNGLREQTYISTFVLVFNSLQPRVTRAHRDMMEIFQAVFGTDFLTNAVIVFHHWSESEAAKRRREHQGDTKEKKKTEMMKLLRDNFEVFHDIPCFFMDSIDYEMNPQDPDLQLNLDMFFRVAANMIPYHTINIRDLMQRSEDLRTHILRQSELIEQIPRETSHPAAIDTVRRLVEEYRVPEPDPQRGPQRALVRANLNRALVEQNHYRNGLNTWRNISNALRMVSRYGETVQQVAPVQIRHHVRNLRLVIHLTVEVGDAVASFTEKQWK